MKRFFSIVFCFVLLSTLTLETSQKANASEAYDQAPFPHAVKVSEHTQPVSDDTFLTITIYEESISTRASRYTKTGASVYTLKNNSGASLWQFTVQGTFIITSGISSTCTAVSHSYEIYNTDWKYVSASSYRSGNSAYGNAEFIRKLLGITVETEGCSLVLSCDVNGNLS